MTPPPTPDAAAPRRSPWAWVPSLYLAEGLPYVLVITVSVVMYKRLGLANAEIALYTSWLYLPWVIKPLWSPLVELLGTRRQWVLAMQLLLGAGLAGVALTLPTGLFLQGTLACLWLIAFGSATHDVAADGFYMLGLAGHQQAWFNGVRSTCYRVALILGQGLLVVLAGFLERSTGSVPLAWSLTFYLVAGTFLLLTLWHVAVLPRPDGDRPGPSRTVREILHGSAAVFAGFFRKPGIGTALAFILLYRFAEAQLVKLATPFLLDEAAAGGLGLSTGEVGFVYGTIGTVALTVGGLLGGIAAARHGLRYWLPWMVAAINLPNGVYVFLSVVRPADALLVNAAVALEQFGYGFGFTALVLYMIYVADGAHRTAHYAICTGFMALGMMVPGMASGWLQAQLGYRGFFLWVLLATVPSFVVALRIPLEASFGRREEFGPAGAR